MEGRIWQCRWQRCDNVYRVWVARRPKLVATSSDWQTALDDLCSTICLKTGDGEPILQIDPPATIDGGDAEYSDPEWLLLFPGGQLPLEDAKPEHFDGGLCSHCGRGRGRRTRVPLKAVGKGDGDLCNPSYFFRGHRPIIFSESCLKALTKAEKAGFDVLEIQRAPRTQKRYFECIPRSFVPPVGVKGWTLSGWRCTTCKAQMISCTSCPKFNYIDSQIHDWLAASDLPKRPLGMLAYGNETSWMPLLPTARARSLSRSSSARGALVTAIARAPSSRVIRRPKLGNAPKAAH